MASTGIAIPVHFEHWVDILSVCILVSDSGSFQSSHGSSVTRDSTGSHHYQHYHQHELSPTQCNGGTAGDSAGEDELMMERSPCDDAAPEDDRLSTQYET